MVISIALAAALAGCGGGETSEGADAGGSETAVTESSADPVADFKLCIDESAGLTAKPRPPVPSIGVTDSFGVNTPDDLVFVDFFDTDAKARSYANASRTGSKTKYDLYGAVVVNHLFEGPGVETVKDCAAEAAG